MVELNLITTDSWRDLLSDKTLTDLDPSWFLSPTKPFGSQILEFSEDASIAVLTRKVTFLTGLPHENRLASIKLAQQYIENGGIYERGLWKGFVVGLLAPSLLMACGEATEPENADLESELNGEDVEETEQGLTFAPLSDAGDVVSYVKLGRYVGEWFEIATTVAQQAVVREPRRSMPRAMMVGSTSPTSAIQALSTAAYSRSRATPRLLMVQPMLSLRSPSSGLAHLIGSLPSTVGVK